MFSIKNYVLKNIGCKIYKYILFIFVITIISIKFVNAQVSSSNIGSSSNPLTGNVVLEEQLPPLSESMQAGHKFIPKAIGVDNPANQWCLIPNWLAGSWHLQQAVWPSVFGDNVVNNPPLPDKIFGYQKDKNGDIWDFVGTPQMENHLDVYFLGFWNKYKKSYFITSNIQIVKSDDEQLSCIRTSSELKTKNDIILKSNQLQVYEIWSKTSQAIKKHQTLRLYSSLGHKIKTDENDCYYIRSAPFSQINTDSSELDYHLMFIEYLKSTGRSNLIPDNTSN